MALRDHTRFTLAVSHSRITLTLGVTLELEINVRGDQFEALRRTSRPCLHARVLPSRERRPRLGGIGSSRLRSCVVARRAPLPTWPLR